MPFPELTLSKLLTPARVHIKGKCFQLIHRTYFYDTLCSNAVEFGMTREDPADQDGEFQFASYGNLTQHMPACNGLLKCAVRCSAALQASQARVPSTHSRIQCLHSLPDRVPSHQAFVFHQSREKTASLVTQHGCHVSATLG